MFTGIVEETGTVLSFEQTPLAWRLRLAANLVRTGVALGDSLAINGCCLTVAAIEEDALSSTCWKKRGG